MKIINKALENRRNNPIKIAISGAGFIASGLVNKINNQNSGIKISLLINRSIENAVNCFKNSNIEPIVIENKKQLEKALQRGTPAITNNPDLIESGNDIDCLVESTGTIEYAAEVITKALLSGKHVITVNAEIDSLLGPYFSSLAKKNDLIYSGADGDQPAVQINLLQFAESVGANPLVAGNIKGFLDRHRTPKTQETFANRWNQSTKMATSFADGTKIAFEQATVANATGFTIPKQGMNGFEFNDWIDQSTKLYDHEKLLDSGGIVDFVVGAKPSPGVYVIADYPNKFQHEYLEYLKLGSGPLYVFYTPYHLCHLEVSNSIAKAVIFEHPSITPTNGPIIDVIAKAKQDLKPGTLLDGIGGYQSYGVCETREKTQKNNYLLMGLSQGVKIKNHISMDDPITIKDVEFPKKRLVDELKEIQDKIFT